MNKQKAYLLSFAISLALILLSACSKYGMSIDTGPVVIAGPLDISVSYNTD